MQLRSTTLFLWAGVLALVFGLLALFWPLGTAVAVATLWGVYAIVDGVLHLVLASRAGFTGPKGWLIGTGVLGILAGALVLFLPSAGLTAVVWVLAAWLLLRGIFLLAGSRHRGAGRAASVLGGILWIIASLVLFAHPTVGAAALSTLAGIFAILFGLLVLAGALFFRSVGNRIREAQTRAGYGYGAHHGPAAGTFRVERPGGGSRNGGFDNGNVIEGETTNE